LRVEASEEEMMAEPRRCAWCEVVTLRLEWRISANAEQGIDEELQSIEVPRVEEGLVVGDKQGQWGGGGGGRRGSERQRREEEDAEANVGGERRKTQMSEERGGSARRLPLTNPTIKHR
jgi:hypothetical protein